MRQRLAVAFLLTASVLLVPLCLPATPTAADEDPGSADPRTGTVLAVQGRALARPSHGRRWTLLRRDAVLLPGDTVKTSARGAHALEVQLASDGALLLGPNALATLPDKGVVRVLRGDVEVKGTADAPVRVEGPGAFARDVTGTAIVRVKEKTTALLEEAPPWLEGYRASADDEWMGSLLANVDGRNVPLAVGYHHVTVDVRDQIARTTVEQSFVNSTAARLEGVFYFPLPADASISGFAMWIGNELVEADVVEKARARQIYEDILRRKKDPGLLEWQGGNLFKARVFPIEPHAEKRIRLRYTQVLSLEGRTFRYRYALRSELLRSKPLRRLDMRVNVLSTRPMKAVASPSHECLIQRSPQETEASVSFEAEEYTPTRDFELAVTLEPTTGLTSVTHRRGDDGTFMLLLSPPSAEGAGWTRELAPEGDPLDLVVVADTSGSMDAAARRTQAGFLDALLDLLGPDDRFLLLAADVDVHAAFDGLRPVDETTRAAAREFLGGRVSLGWTDLDRTFERALEAAPEGAVVIYLGDGIPTTGAADPVAQAERLKRRAEGAKATVHAVSVSSTFEKTVLDAMTAIGGGSVRRADGDPASAAWALLTEVSRPMLRNAKVEIEGIPTARVYPTRLPNLPVGGQQVVLGRYLPGPDAREGRVVVTGDLDGESVRFASTLRLPDADAGNSFLPRLWARRHLDALLAQGTAAAVKDEIVSFSAEHGILTPYTSLLVLESDQDRERYGVARTVQMRDGEAFFAEGRDKVALEMAREQARKARAWRQGLRRRMLGEIAGLGRDLLPDRPVAGLVAYGEEIHSSYGWSGPSGGGYRGPGGDRGLEMPRRGKAAKDLGLHPSEPVIRDEEIADHVETDNDLPFEESLGEEGLSDAPPGARIPASPTTPPPAMARRISEDFDRLEGGAGGRFGGRGGRRRLTSLGAPLSPLFSVEDKSTHELLERSVAGRVEQQFDRLLGGLTPAAVGFPWMTDAPEPRPTLPDPDWGEDVVSLLKRLDRRAALSALPGGLRAVWQSARVHPVRNDEVLASTSETVLASAARWFARSDGDRGSAAASWVDGEHRVHTDLVRQLGRRRTSVDADLRDVPLLLSAFAYDDFVNAYRRHRLTVDDTKSRLVHLRIEADELDGMDRVLIVDPERAVIVEERWEQRGRVLTRIRHRGLVQVAGLWWPRLSQTFDVRGRMVHFVSREISVIDAEGFALAFAEATAFSESVLFLDGRLPKLADAKQARHESRGAFADHLTVALHEAGRQRWDEAFAAWHAARALAGDALGVRWIDLSLLQRARRGPQALARALSLVPAALDAAEILYGAVDALGPHERLSLLARLEAGWRAGGAPAALRFDRARATLLDQAGRAGEARAVRAKIAVDHPFDVQAILNHASDLQVVGKTQEAFDLLEAKTATVEPERFTLEERGSLYGQLTDLLWAERDLSALASVLDRWVETTPTREAWRRRVSLRFLRGDVEGADRWIVDELAREVPTDPLSLEFERLQAGVQLALGNAWLFNARRVEPAFLPGLVALGRRVARQAMPHADLLRSIDGPWIFRRTDGHRLLQEGLRADCLEAGPSLGIRRLALYAGSVPWGRSDVEPDVFTAFLAGLETRWTGMAPGRERDALAALRVRLFDLHGDSPQAAGVLRTRLAAERGFRRARTATALFDRVLGMPFSASLEDEAFSLLGELFDPLAPRTHRRVAAAAARRLARWAYDGHRKAALGPPEARSAMTRAEARAHARLATAKARRALTARLAAARSASSDPVARWLELERLGYAVELAEALPDVIAAAYELLDGVPKTSDDPLDAVLAERCILVLDHAAVRKSAPEGTADVLLAYVAARDGDAADERLDWKYEAFRLLLALDRAKTLEASLRTWIEPSRVRSLWRVALGYVLAEQSRLDEATRLFEQVAVLDELGPNAYGTLAGWYLVLGDDAARERALEGQARSRNDGELARLLRQSRNRARFGPDDFDPEILRTIRWLLRKSSRPQNHIWLLRPIYENVRDHRLLESIAEGLPGHTPEAMYGFVREIGKLTTKVFEEATVDAATARIEALLREAKTPHDRRGLLLLEVLLRTRGALVQGADPIHATRAIAALAEAEKGDWGEGESRLVADLLAATAPVKHESLARARVRLLRNLLGAEPADSPHRLGIADALARVLWAHEERGDAIERLSVALDAARVEGRLPHTARASFDRLVNWTTEVGHFREADRLLQAEIQSSVVASRRAGLRTRLLGVHAQAMAAGGATSLGSGEALLVAGTDAANRWLSEGPANQARLTLQAVVSLHQGAKKTGAVADPDAAKRFETWARETLPAYEARFPLEYTALAQNAADGLRSLAGPREALSYALDRMDAEPSFLDRIARDYWSNDHYDLARWRKDAAPIGDLAGKLLPRVVASLREHLRGEGRTGQSFWSPGYGQYWAQRADDFAVAASAEIELRPKDVTLQKRAAGYLRELGRKREAVAALEAAQARGDLDPVGLKTLATWLVKDERYAKARDVLAILLETRPDDLDVRMLDVRALHALDRAEDALAAFAATETRWREKKRWNHRVAERLGATALDLKLAGPAETWLEEAVRLRTEGTRGGADGTLGRIYGLLARARGLLGKTDAAVDAASAGIVAWGRSARNRGRALRALETLLLGATDLDAYVERYEAKVAKTGLDAPVIRKALATVYTQKTDHAKAAHHLLAAREIAPEDAEIHQRLVATYDALGRADAALEALLASLAQAPRNLEAAADLARRYAAAGREVEAERARTNLVEPLPHEANGHRRLAALRQAAKNDRAALVQFAQVVRTDPLDPTGWLAKARCESALGLKDQARKTLGHVLATTWEPRFGDVHKEAAALIRQLE